MAVRLRDGEVRSSGFGVDQSDSFTAQELLGRLMAILDPCARATKIATFISEAPARRAALWLEMVCREARGDGPMREAARLVLSDWATVKGMLTPRTISEARVIAEELGLDLVAQLLDNGNPQKGHREMREPSPSHPKGLTLGERRALARRISPRIIETLLMDPDPGVIRRLLWNPRVTETEVLKIASRNPVSPSILREVALCPRWMSRYRVKLALVLNPFCPLSVSLSLVKLILHQDLPTVFHKEDLNPRLREEARSLWKRNDRGLSSRSGEISGPTAGPDRERDPTSGVRCK